MNPSTGSLLRRATLSYCTAFGLEGSVVEFQLMLRHRGFRAPIFVVRYGLRGEVPVGRRA